MNRSVAEISVRWPAIYLAAAGVAAAQVTPKAPPDAEQLGKRIVIAINERDAAAFDELLDAEAMIDRVMSGLPELHHRQDLRSDLMLGAAGIGETLTTSFGGQAVASLVRIRDLEGERRALVRLDLGDRGISYLDFVLAERARGLRIVDWHDYGAGQTASQSVQQALALALPASESLVARLLGLQQPDPGVLQDFTDLVALARAQDFVAWLERYDRSTERLRTSRLMLLQRVMAANTAQREELYREALGDLSRYFGDDPGLALVLIDHYIFQEDYVAAHRAVDRLRQHTGGDAAVDGIDANIFYLQRDYTEATRWSRRAVEQDPRYLNAYWTLLDSLVFTGGFDEAASVLGTLERDFGFEFDVEDLAASEGYAAFAESAQFERWKQRRAAAE